MTMLQPGTFLIRTADGFGFETDRFALSVANQNGILYKITEVSMTKESQLELKEFDANFVSAEINIVVRKVQDFEEVG